MTAVTQFPQGNQDYSLPPKSKGSGSHEITWTCTMCLPADNVKACGVPVFSLTLGTHKVVKKPAMLLLHPAD